MLLCCRELHRLTCELDSAGLRAAVLLETIETLQAGGASEQAQRVVALTAQLAAAQAQGGAQEARLRELMVRGFCYSILQAGPELKARFAVSAFLLCVCVHVLHTVNTCMLPRLESHNL